MLEAVALRRAVQELFSRSSCPECQICQQGGLFKGWDWSDRQGQS